MSSQARSPAALVVVLVVLFLGSGVVPAPAPVHAQQLPELGDVLEQLVGAVLKPPRELPPTSPTPAALVELGRKLFTAETFGGNGRTCATCHPLARNTTLGLADIAALPDRDPLFVAEFTAALQGPTPYRRFEEPALMRGAALICENLDGFDEPCLMRSIPHTLALPTSITPVPGDVGPGVHALGWGGNGAPGDGSLRSFAIGAVRQHFTRSLARVEGVDFRMPTDAELDALEAFQLSLGRRADVQLPLRFLDPVVAAGQVEFLRDDEAGGAVFCENCHHNAGANGIKQGANRMNLTGTEQMEGTPGHVIAASVGLPPPPFDDGPGTQRFNAPPLIEAADTPPFFHNGACRTLECAVQHYGTLAFERHNNHPRVTLSAAQVESIAAFLRAMNALENLRSADAALVQADAPRAGGGGPPALRKELLEIARSEILDAQVVLEQGSLFPRVVTALGSIREKIPRGQVGQVRQEIARARAQIVVE